jgi:hypothetical protein
MASLTYTNIFNAATSTANQLQRQEVKLTNGNFFRKLVKEAEKRMSLSDIHKEGCASELSEAIKNCFGSEMPEIYNLNFEVVTSCIERINAFHKAKQDAEAYIAKATAEAEATKAKAAEAQEKRTKAATAKAKANV